MKLFLVSKKVIDFFSTDSNIKGPLIANIIFLLFSKVDTKKKPNSYH